MAEYRCTRCDATVEAENLDELPPGQCAGGHSENPYHGWAGDVAYPAED